MLCHLRRAIVRHGSRNYSLLRCSCAPLHRLSQLSTVTFSTSSILRQDCKSLEHPAEPPLLRRFSPDLPSVTICCLDGSTFRQNIRTTPKANREKLSRALEVLLNRSLDATPAQRSDNKRWMLDNQGDAIHRHLTFATRQEADSFRAALIAEADGMNHHPHTTGDVNLTITCTTHNPRGLSMRDIKLATKVEDLASEHCALDPAAPDFTSSLEQQSEQRGVNRVAIDRALNNQAGACFPSEKIVSKS